jgi:RNA polymerase sigma factor (TIGR02999 family)
MDGPNNNNKEQRIAELLAQVDSGDDAALDELVTLVYPDLKTLAHFQLASERPNHTLNTTAIVHEAFVRLAGGNRAWTDQAHFLRAASKVMRHLLVDHARKRNTKKRGEGQAPLELDEQRYQSEDESMAVLALDTALDDMASIDPRLVNVIECRYFAGLTVAETAEALGMTARTVERDWQRARGYLFRAMKANTR